MAAWRAELTTKQQVIAFYENSPLVRYKVYAGNKPDDNCMRWEYEGEEKLEGLHELGMACDAILANPSNINSYTLQLIRSDKLIKLGEHKAAKRVHDAINIVFQLNGIEGAILPYNQRMAVGAGVDSELTQLLKKQSEQLNALTSLMTAKIEAESVAGIEPESDVMTLGERVLEPFIGLLENPVLQNALAEKICGLLMPNNKPVAMAGLSVDENDKLIGEAVAILKQYTPTLGADLMKLASIAQADKSQFNMLLTVLRGQ